MKVKNILIFLMAFALLIQPPTGVMAAESDTESMGGEQAELKSADDLEEAESANGQTETESTNGQEDKKEAENMTDDAELVPDISEESRIALELPMLEGVGFSPFDFIMDPQRLITKTNAAKYGGAKFEEGATLYFRNAEGDYEYSHKSDWLSVTSHSNVPVCVTVELSVEGTDNVDMVQDTLFSDDGKCSMYLALLDVDGNEMPVSEEGKATFQMMLPACENEEDASVCSFALTGCCSPYGNWLAMGACPHIVVNWTVEPIISEEEEYVH